MPIVFENPNYAGFKELASKRLHEAKCLLAAGHFSGAYYLGGYIVEMALKACYCKNVKEGSFPPEKKVYDNLYSHNLNKLLEASGAKLSYDQKITVSQKFALNWNVVKDWDAKSRYCVIDESSAMDIISAVDDVDDGVFNWIQTLW